MTGAELLRATVNFWGTVAATGLIFTPFAGDGPVIYAHALWLIVRCRGRGRGRGRGPLFWLIADGSWFIIYSERDRTTHRPTGPDPGPAVIVIERYK